MEVDDDGDFTRDEKKTVNIVMKKEALAFLFKMYNVVNGAFMDPKPVLSENIDLDRSGVIAGIMSTIFTHLRKTANKNSVYDDTVFKNRETQFPSGQKASFDSFKKLPEYIELEAMNVDYAVATPIMNMLSLYKLRVAEVRMGVKKFTTKKVAGKKTEETDISSYGLCSAHLPRTS